MTVFGFDDLDGLPESALSKAEFAPVEDVLLPLLRQALPGVRIYSEVPDGNLFPFVIVRVAPTERWWSGDDRFVDWATVFVHVFAGSPDGDRKAAILSEAVRVALRDAYLNSTVTEHGYISSFRMTNRPSRRSDWATAQGPVQYADLPAGVTRYEAMYVLNIRRPA